MKKLFLILFLLLGVAVTATATTLNFDELSPGIILSNQYALQGIIFSNSNLYLRIYNVTSTLGPPFTLPIAIWADNYFHQGNKSKATFSVPINYFSITMGDRQFDADNLYLRAYDGANNLIGSDDDIIPANDGSSITAATLSVNTLSYIHHVEFWGVGFWENSVYFDNVEFGMTPVPEPSLMVLLGISAMGLVGLRRWWKN